MYQKKRKPGLSPDLPRSKRHSGEDIDMLRERKRSSSYSSNSTRYKDDIDGA